MKSELLITETQELQAAIACDLNESDPDNAEEILCSHTKRDERKGSNKSNS